MDTPGGRGGGGGVGRDMGSGMAVREGEGRGEGEGGRDRGGLDWDSLVTGAESMDLGVDCIGRGYC